MLVHPGLSRSLLVDENVRLVLFDRTVVEIPDDAVDVGACSPQVIAHLTEDSLPVQA